jgi:hypothetical protein
MPSPTFPGVPVADLDPAGSLEMSFTRAIPDGATADYDLVMQDKFEVTDVIVHKRAAVGGAVNTVQVKSTAAVISDAISLNVAQDAVGRAATITAANSVIPAGGILRCSVVKAGGNAACFVTVRGIKRP